MNVSANSVDVSVTFYDEAGSTYIESSEGSTQFGFYWGFNSEDPTNSPATLSPKEDGEILVDKVGNSKGGYAVISWTSSSDEPVALVATARWVYYTGGGDHGGVSTYLLNSGHPF